MTNRQSVPLLRTCAATNCDRTFGPEVKGGTRFCSERCSGWERRDVTLKRVCDYCGELKRPSEYPKYQSTCKACRTHVKRCAECKQFLSVEQFSPTGRTSGDRNAYCKPCMNLRQQRFNKAHGERLRAQGRTPEARAKRVQRLRERRARDPVWAEEQRRRNRARLQRQLLRTLEVLLSRDGNKCYLCSRDLMLPVHIDHIVPRARGGSEAITNLAVVHAKCNLHKSARLPSELTEENFLQLLNQ
jgi:5-methylcytosine-specific restriction endonuclease McrA